MNTNQWLKHCLLSFVEISLPSSHNNDNDEERFHKLPVNQLFDVINKNLQETEVIKTSAMNENSSILKEINKNTSSDHFKVSKKHKFGHGVKKPEPNVLCCK